MIRLPLVSALALGLAAPPGAAQAPRTPAGADSVPAVRFAVALHPDTVTVGDPFVSVIRVSAPPGSRVEFTGLPVADTLQPVDTVRAQPSGESSVAAAYSLVAWVAGAPIAAAAPVRVVLPDGRVHRYRVALALPAVRSVLPADTTGLRPQPARGVLALPRRNLPWPWLLVGAALLAIAITLAWRRRRPRVVPRRDPRAAALAALARLAEAPPGGGLVPLYAAVSRVLRRYLGDLDPAWGEWWTTAELRVRLLQTGMPEEPLRRLVSLLDRADRAKFARESPGPEHADAVLEEARRWVEGYPSPAPFPASAPREAA